MSTTKVQTECYQYSRYLIVSAKVFFSDSGMRGKEDSEASFNAGSCILFLVIVNIARNSKLKFG